MSTETAKVHTNIPESKPATAKPSLRPGFLIHNAQGRIGSPSAISFGWARTSARRFGR